MSKIPILEPTWVLKLPEHVEIPQNPAATGIAEGDAELVGPTSYDNACSDANSVADSPEFYSKIFLDAVRRHL